MRALQICRSKLIFTIRASEEDPTSASAALNQGMLKWGGVPSGGHQYVSICKHAGEGAVGQSAAIRLLTSAVCGCRLQTTADDCWYAGRNINKTYQPGICYKVQVRQNKN